MGTENKNFQQLLFEEFLFFFDPLIQTEGDPEKISAFLNSIGWNFDILFDGSDSSSFTNAVGEVITLTNTIQDIINDPPQEISDLIPVLENAASFTTAILSLDTTMPSLSGAEQLPADLLKKLLVLYIRNRSAVLYQFLKMLNVLYINGGATVMDDSGRIAMNGEVIPDLNLSKLIDYITAPADTFKKDYLDNGFTDLDAVNATALKIFKPLQYILMALNIQSHLGNNSTTTSLTDEENKRLAGLLTLVYSYVLNDAGDVMDAGTTIGLLAETEGGPGIFMVPFGELNISRDIGSWRLGVGVSGNLKGFQLSKDGFAMLEAGENGFALDLTLEKNSEGATDFLIGSATGTRLEIGEMSFNGGIILSDTKKEYFFKALLNNCAIVLKSGDGDGFIQKILSGVDARADFSLNIGWDNGNGFHIDGSGALEIAVPLHITIGPINIDTATIRISPDFETKSIPIDLGIDATLELGPFTGTVQGIGISLGVAFPETGGNMGPLQLSAAFKPPTGLGLSIDAQGFSGGGFLFLDADKGEYAGGLEVSFQDTLSLKIIGILNTIMPDGTNGFSLILIITAEFTPIQLGFGFTLNGVGGLIGINRTVEIDVLQSGVKDGSLNSILFPEDIVANAIQIVTDIKKVFPVYEGQYAFGPMAEIGYGSPTLITLQLGLIIELPDPVRIAILGVLRCLLPDEEFKLLSLQVNFLGVIDFEKKYISFDASLYDSKLLTFTLTGDMALRLSWGSDPVFVLSVGGFHPSYEPPANLGLGDMERLSINLFSGNNPRLRIENYFAVTSNTAQFGANGQLYVSKAGFDVEGYIGFDVLFQFSPFYFIAQISASLSVSYEGEDILSIHLSLSLDGPTPWHAKGKASFSFLVFDVTVSISETFGDAKNTVLAPVDVWPLLEAALKEKANWQAEIPSGSNLLVTLKTIEADDDTIIAHPCGILNISQKLVPLNMNIDKYGNQSVSGDSTFSISKVVIGTEQTGTGTLKEEFAPGQYFEYSDAEKLSSKDFEKYDSGLSVNGSGNLKTDYVAELEVEYELKYLHKKTLFTLIRLNLGLFLAFLKGNATSKSKLAAGVKLPSVIGTQKVQISPEKFVIANTGDLQLVDEAYVFSSEREARLQMEELISSGDILSKNIQVIPSYELNV
jgi:hypothetical protein